MSQKAFSTYEKDSVILQKISANFRSTSEEYRVLKKAALALFFATTQKEAEFSSFVESTNADLTAEEKINLKKLGLKP